MGSDAIGLPLNRYVLKEKNLLALSLLCLFSIRLLIIILSFRFIAIEMNIYGAREMA